MTSYGDDVRATQPKILVADDDLALIEELRALLERSGFEVIVAYSGLETLRRVEETTPDLVVLDVLMPDLDGREVCRRLRAAGDWTPIIMLSQIGAPTERAMSLEEGADDYISKPFEPFELIARIQAVLRRARVTQGSLAVAQRLRSGNLVLDRLARRAFQDDKELSLTPKAYAVLEHLMLHPREVISRERLLDNIWGWDYPITTRAVDIRIAELRRALSDDPSTPRYIETLVGEGYRFIESVKAER